MQSYFFFYFNGADGEVPFFEVVNCRDDGHAVMRCEQLLGMRKALWAEVWIGECMIRRVQAGDDRARETMRAAVNPPHAGSSLSQ